VDLAAAPEGEPELFNSYRFPQRNPCINASAMLAVPQGLKPEFIVVYQVKPDAVEISRIFHGAQDWS
jgi:plasmid stabilization system protein ParE